MSTPDFKDPKKIEESIHFLLKGISNLFEERGTACATRSDLTSLKNWSDSISKKLKFTKIKALRASEITSEFWHCMVECQVNLGLAVKVQLTGKLHPGVQMTYYNDFEYIQPTILDSVFWLFMGNAVESIYRLWSRIEVLILFLNFDLDLKEATDRERAVKNRIRYLPDMLAEMKKNCAVQPLFAELESAAVKRGDLADYRNDISHRASSLFSKFEYDIKAAGIVDISGRTLETVTVSFPDPAKEVERVRVFYGEPIDCLNKYFNFMNSL